MRRNKKAVLHWPATFSNLPDPDLVHLWSSDTPKLKYLDRTHFKVSIPPLETRLAAVALS